MFLNVYPNLTYIVLGILLVIGAISGIYDYRLRKPKKQPLAEEQKYSIASKISHSHDLKKLYDRIASIRAEKNKQNKLIFTVSPLPIHNISENTNMDEARKRISEYNDQLSGSWTPINIMVDSQHALKHLENKEYKNIHKHWNKANKLLEKYNKNNNEETKTQIDDALQTFRQELLTLVDKLDNDHIMKGKCDVCP